MFGPSLDPGQSSSPFLSRLTFQPFHLQPPHIHFATSASARYCTQRCLTESIPLAEQYKCSRDGRRSVKSSIFSRNLPDRIGRIEFAFATDWLFSSDCSPPFITETQLPCWIQGSNVTLVGTFTQLIKRLQRRTSRHIPCAVHRKSLSIHSSGRHGGACLLLLSAVSGLSPLKVLLSV